MSRDALAWAEQQAALLRRLAAGERLNEAVDWPNVIEELQDVGLSELRACRSLLAQALAHLLKLRGWPEIRRGALARGDGELPGRRPAKLHTVHEQADRLGRPLRGRAL